jgi:hypothetical protein
MLFLNASFSEYGDTGEVVGTVTLNLIFRFLHNSVYSLRQEIESKRLMEMNYAPCGDSSSIERNNGEKNTFPDVLSKEV